MQRQEGIRQFLVWNLDGHLDRLSVFDTDEDALRAYEAAERALEPGEQCVLLGADRLATLLATHGNWFDEPSKLYQILDESSFRPKSGLDELERLRKIEAAAEATYDACGNGDDALGDALVALGLALAGEA